jgi:hypothetical protein
MNSGNNPLNRLAFLAALLLATSLGTATAQTLIYSNSFTGGATALDGSAVDYSSGTFGSASTWQAGNTFLANGTAGTTVASSANGQAAWLPFTPLVGYVYTATATILNNQNNWVAFGFTSNAPPSGQTWQSTNFSVRHSNSGGFAWILTRTNATASNVQQAFNGMNTSSQALAGQYADPTAAVTLQIVLDASQPTWTATYSFNGVQQGGTFSLPSAANADIGGIGFSHDRSATANSGGLLSNFTLTEIAVPEPSAFALGLVAFAGLSLRRRRGQ